MKRDKGRWALALGGIVMLASPDAAVGGVPTDRSAPLAVPAPVSRYFRKVLPEQPPASTQAEFRQEGSLRTGTNTDRWMPFTASETMARPAPRFTWDAQVAMMPLVSLQVLDAYQDGIGQGQVRLYSLLPMASDRGTPELNSGALHRYLAEAVWFPVALLPSEHLRWSPIDDRRALATLTDHGTAVSLEFRFNSSDEVEAVYSPGRWGSFDGGYKQVAWEGHFRDYFECGGMRIPRYGEVGWYDGGEWKAVWKGNVTRAEFRP